MLPLHQSPRDSIVFDRVNQIVRISGFRCKPGRKGEPALGFGFGPGKLSPSLEPRRTAVPISGLATGPPAGVGGGSDRFWARELRVSQQISTFYGSSVQAMDA